MEGSRGVPRKEHAKPSCLRNDAGMPEVYAFEKCPFRDIAHAVADRSSIVRHTARALWPSARRAERVEISDEGIAAWTLDRARPVSAGTRSRPSTASGRCSAARRCAFAARAGASTWRRSCPATRSSSAASSPGRPPPSQPSRSTSRAAATASRWIAHDMARWARLISLVAKRTMRRWTDWRPARSAAGDVALLERSAFSAGARRQPCARRGGRRAGSCSSRARPASARARSCGRSATRAASARACSGAPATRSARRGR